MPIGIGLTAYDLWHAAVYLSNPAYGVPAIVETLKGTGYSPFEIALAVNNFENPSADPRIQISGSCARGPFQFLDLGTWTRPNAANFPAEATGLTQATGVASDSASCELKTYFQDMVWSQVYRFFQWIVAGNLNTKDKLLGALNGQFGTVGVRRFGEADADVAKALGGKVFAARSLSKPPLPPLLMTSSTAGTVTPIRSANLSMRVTFYPIEDADFRFPPITETEGGGEVRVLVEVVNHGPETAYLVRPWLGLLDERVAPGALGYFVKVPDNPRFLLGPPAGSAPPVSSNPLAPNAVYGIALTVRLPDVSAPETINVLYAQAYGENSPITPELTATLRVVPSSVAVASEQIVTVGVNAENASRSAGAGFGVRCISAGFPVLVVDTGRGQIEACAGEPLTIPVTVSNGGTEVALNVVLCWDYGCQELGDLAPGEQVAAQVTIVPMLGYQTVHFSIRSDNAPATGTSDVVVGLSCPAGKGPLLGLIGAGVALGLGTLAALGAGRRIRRREE